VQIAVLLALAGLFFLLGLVRLGGAQRTLLLKRGPALLLGLGAVVTLLRGGVELALGLGAGAALLWFAVPSQLRTRTTAEAAPGPDPRDLEAARILGVSVTANAAEIRRTYRAKMAQAHPDRGGSHAEAARLTAARDRLLGR